MAKGRRFGLAVVSSNAVRTGVAARLFAAVCALLLAVAMVPLAPAQQSAYADEQGSANGEIFGFPEDGTASPLAVGLNDGMGYSAQFRAWDYSEEYNAIPYTEKNLRSYWKVESSDPSVLDVDLVGSADRGWGFYFTPKSPGTATISVAYSYDKWGAQSSFTLVVLEKENVATSLTLDTDSLTLYALENCPECGGFHHAVSGDMVGYTVSAEDPSQPLSSYRFEVDDTDFLMNPTNYGTRGLGLYPNQLGEKPVTISIVSNATDEVWATATLNVKVEAQKPAAESKASETTIYMGSYKYVGSLVSLNEAGSAYLFNHGSGGNYSGNYIKNITSSNPEVASVSERTVDFETMRTIVAESPGEATITIEDVFGETTEIVVMVKSIADADLTGIGFNQRSITLKLGELAPNEYDLVTEGAREALAHDFSWTIGVFSREGQIVDFVTEDYLIYMKAVGVGSAVAEMQIANPEDPGNPIIADTMTITVLGEEVASSSDDSVVSAAVEASNLATLEAVRAAVEAADDKQLVLSVQDVADLTEAARASIVSLASGETHIAGQFDIHFATASSGQEVVINKDADDNLLMTVRIALTDAMKALDPSTLTVWYVADDGTTEKKTTWVEDGNLCFTTEHFSNYVVTGELAGAGSTGGNVTGGSATGGNAANENVDGGGAGDNGTGADVKTAVLAQTGDTLPLAAGIMCAGVLCAAAAFIVARRKLS